MLKDFLLKLKKVNDFRPAWYSVFINPYFVARRGLFLPIRDFARGLKKKDILDVGCGSRPYEVLFSTNDYAAIDVEGGGHKKDDKLPDQYFDGQNIPYEDGVFDAAICTEVLEHSPEPEKLVAEIARILKSKGKLYVSVPFVWYEHEVPYDFRRFTSYGFKKLLENDFVVERMAPTSGVFACLAQIFSAFVIENFRPKNAVTYPLLSALVCAPAMIAGIFIDKLLGRRYLTLGWTAVARKK
jgi:SAM-dependent methyltransferase